MPPLAALIVALTVILLALAMAMVGRARGRFAIKAPATTGHPDFERVFRAQMNTNEQALMFLPSFWLAVHYGWLELAAVMGLVWLVARTWYLFAYARDASRRDLPFIIATVALVVLLLDGLRGLLMLTLAA